ncbi:hypothetical protein K438DRAFT_2024125 [Mycena galopus ATCC 62051]|nr:hypothetical protein K438DRAFT_2024125 [Mycena galopus ATCC 62051]
MLTPLTALSPTALTVHWMDSPLIPASASTFHSELTSHFGFGLRLPSPFLDPGRPEDFGSLGHAHNHYAVEEGGYQSLKIPFHKRIDANKNDLHPRWTGFGLGLGLTGIDDLENTYVLSRRPTFLESAANELAGAEPEHEAVAESDPSLWEALTEFLDTTYSLSDSPTFESAMHQPEVTPTSTLNATISVPAVVEASPTQVLCLEPIGFTVTALLIPSWDSPASMASKSPAFSIPSSSPLVSSPASIASTSPACATTNPTLRVSFAPKPSFTGRMTTERPAWFAHEEARAADLARRFHIGRDVSPWDRRRARCVVVERQLAEDALRRMDSDSVFGSFEQREEEEQEGKIKMRKPRFSLCGLPYPLLIRQQRMRNEGEMEREAKRVRWLRREEELAEVERWERECVREVEEPMRVSAMDERWE